MVCIFNEYEGIEIPKLPFEYKVDRASNPMPKDKCQQIYKTNVKVFEKDPRKREQIIGIFVESGFIFVTDCITSTLQDGTKVHCRDRIVFESTKAMC